MEIGVIGAGGWGTTLSNLLAEKGNRVTLWVYEEDLCRIMKKTRENPLYLPGVKLSANIEPTNSLPRTVSEKELIITATPSHILRGVLDKITSSLPPRTTIVSVTKGIEGDTYLTPSQVLKEILPLAYHRNLAVLSGPSFAKEVSVKVPTAVTVASNPLEVALKVQATLSTPYFRIYTSSDVLGVELSGALKNVIAIAAGISDGLGFGHNTRAAIITRGLAEIARLGVKMGAQPLTFSGLAGLGDLVLTCTSDLSRNRTVGLRIGKGEKLSHILPPMRMVAEGVKTAESAYQLSQKWEAEMPITEQVYLILYKEKSPREAVQHLMSRKLKEELD